MKTTPVRSDDIRGVFPVPPLARSAAPGRPIDFEANDAFVRHMVEGGLTRFLYGGNAFLYHVSLADYEALLDWLSGFADPLWAIPCAMALPCSDPRDAGGLEAGLTEIAQAAAIPLILYLKEETTFGRDLEAGLDAVARLVEARVCVALKYAVVRKDPAVDPYLEGLLRRVDKRLVVSGIGERPAVIHMFEFGLPGFTTGSGCLAPRLSHELHATCLRGEAARAEEQRRLFLPLEDARDAHGPARVLHEAVALSGLVATGPIPLFVSGLDEGQRAEVETAARALLVREREQRAVAVA